MLNKPTYIKVREKLFISVPWRLGRRRFFFFFEQWGRGEKRSRIVFLLLKGKLFFFSFQIWWFSIHPKPRNDNRDLSHANLSIYFYSSKPLWAAREATVTLTVESLQTHSAPQIQERKSNQRPFKSLSSWCFLSFSNPFPPPPPPLFFPTKSHAHLLSSIWPYYINLAGRTKQVCSMVWEMPLTPPASRPPPHSIWSSDVSGEKQNGRQGCAFVYMAFLCLWSQGRCCLRRQPSSVSQAYQNWLFHFEIHSLQTKYNIFPYSYANKNGWMY